MAVALSDRPNATGWARFCNCVSASASAASAASDAVIVPVTSCSTAFAAPRMAAVVSVIAAIDSEPDPAAPYSLAASATSAVSFAVTALPCRYEVTVSRLAVESVTALNVIAWLNVSNVVTCAAVAASFVVTAPVTSDRFASAAAAISADVSSTEATEVVPAEACAIAAIWTSCATVAEPVAVMLTGRSFEPKLLAADASALAVSFTS